MWCKSHLSQLMASHYRIHFFQEPQLTLTYFCIVLFPSLWNNCFPTTDVARTKYNKSPMHIKEVDISPVWDTTNSSPCGIWESFFVFNFQRTSHDSKDINRCSCARVRSCLRLRARVKSRLGCCFCSFWDAEGSDRWRKWHTKLDYLPF